jgi:HlyD family secretion protein
LEQNKLALDRAEAERRLLQQKKEELARRTKLDAERAKLRLEHAREAIRLLQERIELARVTAPIDGVLYSFPVRTGDFVREGDLLAEVADLRSMRVRAFVDEPELGRLSPNQTVDIIWDAYPNQVWTGRVGQLPKSVVSRGTRNVGEVLCSVNNDNLKLLPGVNVDVRIRVTEARDVLLVPRAAVRSQGARYYVFVLRGDRLQTQEIKVGAVSATNYQVLEGLAMGDRLALPGEVDLHDGLVVRATDQK